MICPICNSNSENKNRCSKCGSDLTMYAKLADISKVLYNKGLYAAKSNELTHAEQFLGKSILFDKNNLDARNVLGLVYYETGKIGLALKQWVISANMKKENNQAKEYVDYFQRNSEEFQKLNEAVKLYNQSVRFLKQKSEDMAVIQLKKAVDLNPKFVEALNLLSVFYMQKGENDLALDVIKSVLNIDTTNTKALSYFKELCPNGTRLVEGIKIVKTNKAYDEPVKFEPKISRKVRDSKNSKAMELIIFAAGCICTAAVMFLLIIPGVASEKQDELDRLNADMLSLQNQYDSQKELFEQAGSEDIQKENESLRLELSKYQKDADQRTSADQLTSASALSVKGKYSEAADIISKINMSNLSEDKVAEYNSLKSSVYQKEAKNLLKKGTSLVNSKNYQEAKENLEKSILYADEDLTTKYNAMYYLAMAVKELGDTEKAKEYFGQVAQNHPQNRFKDLANKELESL